MVQDYIDVISQRGGFKFDNHARNVALTRKMNGEVKFPAAKKTGTTICGVVCKDQVVLQADTRQTCGPIVQDKNQDKLHPIQPNIQCQGQGTSQDLTQTTELMERQMELHRLNTQTETRVCTVVNRLKQMLFRYQGHIGCQLVLGGVDSYGPHLYQIYPHGSTDKLPFTSMGSGSLQQMQMLETRYKTDMTVEEGTELVQDQIQQGIFNDLGSGGNVDVCVIYKDHTKKHTRQYREPNNRVYKQEYPRFKNGATEILSESFKKRGGNDDQAVDSQGDVVMA